MSWIRCLGRKRHRRTWMLFLVAMATVFIVLFHSSERYCSKKYIEDLCVLYRRKEIDGKFCHALCEHQDLHYDKCSFYDRGKKVVPMTCDTCDNGKPASIMMKTDVQLEKRERMILFFDKDGNITPETVHFVIKIIKESILFHTGLNASTRTFGVDVSSNDKLLSFLWDYDFSQYVKENGPNATVTAIQSIWSVLQQDEYRFTKVHARTGFVPKLYGTCGPMYFVENTPPGSELGSFPLPRWPVGWKDRAKIAIRMLDLVQVFETRLHQRLHLCDVKGDNFGIRGDNSITLIDTDCVFYHNALMDQFKHSNCSSDLDCDFFDCRGICNLTSNMCLLTRLNNNLQTVCEDVFLRRIPGGFTGLLRSPPGDVREELQLVLQDCAYPDNKIKSRMATPLDVGYRLQHILRKSLL